VQVERVERAVENHYRSIGLSDAECAEVRRELKQQVEIRLDVAKKQSERHSRRLRDLQSEQQKLLQLFYNGGVDEDVLKAEQQRIETERNKARRWVESATHEAAEALEALDEAIAIVHEAHRTYRDGDAELRRLMNQAIFERIIVRVDELQTDQAPIYGQIHRLARTSTPTGTKQAQNDQDPRFLGGLGSDVIQMVRMRGLEPPPGCPDTDLNRARLPIPPHPRADAKISQTRSPGRMPAGQACSGWSLPV
jgi:hypothetical protein